MAVAAASAGGSAGEELNTREVNVLASLRDLFALSVVDEVRCWRWWSCFRLW